VPSTSKSTPLNVDFGGALVDILNCSAPAKLAMLQIKITEAIIISLLTTGANEFII
jgi:hypothetical protein